MNVRLHGKLDKMIFKMNGLTLNSNAYTYIYNNFPLTWFHFLSQILKYERAAAAAAKSLQSCPTLCDPRDGSPPGSSVLGVLQARTLEWVAISFSNAWKWKVKVKSLSRVQLLAISLTAAYQAPPSMGFSRQEYWSGVSLSSPIVLLHSWLSKVDDDKVNQQYLCKRNSNLYPLYLIFQWGNWREYN